MRWLESPDLSAALIAFFGMLATILGGGTITQMMGRKKAASVPPPAFAEIKGAIVDGRDVDRMVKHLEETTAAMTLLRGVVEKDVSAKEALTKALEKHGRCLEENTEACNDMGHTIERIDNRISRLSTEMEIQRAIRERGGK